VAPLLVLLQLPGAATVAMRTRSRTAARQILAAASLALALWNHEVFSHPPQPPT